MANPERSPYEHSLLELCGRIHGHCTGSGDGIPDDEARELRDWLFWRLRDGWTATLKGGPHAFDAAVKRLCYEAFLELDSESRP